MDCFVFSCPWTGHGFVLAVATLELLICLDIRTSLTNWMEPFPPNFIHLKLREWILHCARFLLFGNVFKLYQLSFSEFQYDTGIFRFGSMREVEIHITSPGKLIIYLWKIENKIRISVVVYKHTPTTTAKTYHNTRGLPPTRTPYRQRKNLLTTARTDHSAP